MMYLRPAPLMVRGVHRGDPGIFGSIGRAIGGAVSGFVRGGPLGAITGAIGGATSRPGGAQQLQQASPVLRSPGLTGAIQRLAPGGATGYEVMLGGGKKPGRRMNPGNAKAARRAIRRIKSVRGMLKSIERQLPRRPCACKVTRKR